MGINPTPTNHRSFTFDGKSTREFGVYITGEGVFNAPERAVEMISIPGRDGEYALDQGHFNNIEVTYRAGIVADSTTDFAEAISNFRNWLASREGYCRLTDEYNTEEYRMAVFKNAIALEHEGLLTGEFDVTFDCKPQRYLAIGEELTEIGAWGNTETAEGEVVTIDASSDTAVKALTVDIVPVQSGSGTPSPDNVRPISGWDEVGVSVNGINQWDEEWEVGDIERITGQNNPTQNAIRSTGYIPVIPNTTYYAKCPSANQIRVLCYDANKEYIYIQPDGLLGDYSNSAFTVPNNCRFIRITTRSNYGATYNNDISINYPSTDHDYHAYVGTDYTTTLPSTTYGGTLDVVSGVLTVTHGIVTYDGSNDEGWAGTSSTGWYVALNAMKKTSDYTDLITANIAPTSKTQGWQIDNTVTGYNDANNTYPSQNWLYYINKSISSQADLKTFLASNPLTVVYPLATPTTTTLTPQQVDLLLGENNIFADSGNVTVEYGHNPTLLTNPTWFPSKPLLAVDGYGEIKFNNRSIVNIENATLGDIKQLVNESKALSMTTTFDNAMFNVGDTITVDLSYFNYGAYIIMNASTTPTTSGTVTDSDAHFTTVVTDCVADQGISPSPLYVHVKTTCTPITFTLGTPDTVTNTTEAVVDTQGDKCKWTQTVKYEIDGSGNHKISIKQTLVGASGTNVTTATNMNSNPMILCNSVVAHSTLSILGNPTYIDCDIGEAYMVKDGEPISLNQYIDLGSDLPTLPSGDTEVTYDNTITKVEVKPNYWKV